MPQYYDILSENSDTTVVAHFLSGVLLFWIFHARVRLYLTPALARSSKHWARWDTVPTGLFVKAQNRTDALLKGYSDL